MSAHARYNKTEWASLARQVLGRGANRTVFLASDNAPARAELAARVAELGGTACHVSRGVAPR